MSIRDKGEVPNRVNSLNFEEIYIQHLTSGIAFGDSVDVGMWKRFKSCFTCGIRAGNRYVPCRNPLLCSVLGLYVVFGSNNRVLNEFLRITRLYYSGSLLTDCIPLC